MSLLEARTFGARTSALFAGLFLVLAVSVSAAPDRSLSDLGIRDAVEEEMIFDQNVPFDAIDVSIDDGVVTLTGQVNDLLAKERAVAIAQTVKGVRSVVDRIQVIPRVPRSDADIRKDVTTAFALDPAADSYELGVDVDDGVVTLTGTVDSWQERDLAERIAKSVKGVTGLDDQVEVQYHAVRPDAEIENEVAEALEWDVLVDDGLIDVSVQDGEVRLEGTVGSAAEKRRAERDAWVAGVKGLDVSGLEVARWARDDDLRKHKYVIRTDEEIERAVEAALARDPRVASFDVVTAVEGSVVTLRGSVSHLDAKRAAEDDARNTTGVLRVENRIKVRPIEILSDADIRERVYDALLRDAVVESYDIDVDVRYGRVTLKGDVDSYLEKFHADDVAANVAGVIDVDNELEVEPASAVSLHDPYLDPYGYTFGYEWFGAEAPKATLRTDAEVEEDIEDELWWSPFVDSDDVNVSVEDGVARLTGTVDGWTEVRAAIENAYEGGALAVENDIVVAPPASS